MFSREQSQVSWPRTHQNDPDCGLNLAARSGVQHNTPLGHNASKFYSDCPWRGSLILFSWRMNGHFCFAWSVNEDLLFPWFVNIYFSVLGKLVFDFFMIREICIYLRVICEPTTIAGIIFLFILHFSVIKSRKLHQTRCETCPFDVLADAGLRN